MHKDRRVEKKKTVTMKRCLNPVFNESFPFDVPAHVLRETTIIITVMDKDRLSRNDVIGKASPGCAAGRRRRRPSGSPGRKAELAWLLELRCSASSLSDLLIMEERAGGGEALEGHARSAAHQRRPVARSQSLISPRPLSMPPIPSPSPSPSPTLPSLCTRLAARLRNTGTISHLLS